VAGVSFIDNTRLLFTDGDNVQGRYGRLRLLDITTGYVSTVVGGNLAASITDGFGLNVSFTRSDAISLPYALCEDCTPCGVGLYRSGGCSGLVDAVCSPCLNVVPTNAVYSGNGSNSMGCPWKCANGYLLNADSCRFICLAGTYGENCDPCIAGYFCG
jgi:hypothetical protein